MYDEEIEKAILYYIIFQDEQFELTENDFVNATHKKMIKAINELKARKQEISILAISNKMQGDNMIEYIAMLGEYVTSTSSNTVYKILKAYTKKRQVFKLSKEIQNTVVEAENIDMYIEKVIKALHSIEFQIEQEIDFRDKVIKTVKEIEKNINKKEDRSLYTGYFELDNLTDGLHNGELTVIGARPRSRKDNVFFATSRKYC